MAATMRLACLLVVGHATASFLPEVYPRATIALDNAPGEIGWSPAPTGAPEQVPNIFEERELAAYNTCGFISGYAFSSLTCSPGYSCMTESSVGAVGCCLEAGCLLTTTCIASTDATLASYNMNRVKLCTIGILTECATLAYDYGYAYLSGFSCAMESTRILVSTNTDGAADTAAASSVAYSSFSNAYSSATTTPSLSIAGYLTTSTTSGRLGSQSTSVSVPSPQSKSKSTPVGAITGGVVGGLAVIGAAIAGIVFMLIRHKTKQHNNPSVPNMAANNDTPEYKPPAVSGEAAGFYNQQHSQQQFDQNGMLYKPGFSEPQVQQFSPPISPAPPYNPQFNGQPAMQQGQPQMGMGSGIPPRDMNMPPPTGAPQAPAELDHGHPGGHFELSGESR